VKIRRAERVAVTLTDPMDAYLDDLVKIGAYGANKPDVASYLIRRVLDDLLRVGVLEIKKGIK